MTIAASGRLKIFLGAAPGVGKTYAMLLAAKSRLNDGVDVVAAVVETHGRAETQALLAGIEVIPRRVVDYRNCMVGMTKELAAGPSRSVSGQRAVTVLTLVQNFTPSMPCWLVSPNAERFQPPKV